MSERFFATILFAGQVLAIDVGTLPMPPPMEGTIPSIDITPPAPPTPPPAPDEPPWVIGPVSVYPTENASAPAANAPTAITYLNGASTPEATDLESVIAIPKKPDQSALWLTNGAVAHLNNPHIIKKGDTSSALQSQRIGLNAAIRAMSGSFLSVRGGHISTHGEGASALFGSGSKTLLLLSGTSLRTWQDNSPGLALAAQAQTRSSYLSISTQGASSPALSICGAGSRMLAYGTLLMTEGPQSPAVLCSAGLSMSSAQLTAEMSPALTLEPEGGVTLSQVLLSGTNPAAILLRSQDSNGANGPILRLSLANCDVQGTQGTPALFVSNVQADVNFSGMQIGEVGSRLLQVSAYIWGTAGYNGGNLFLRADASHLRGNVEVDSLSRADIILGQGTVWEGKFSGGGRTSLSLERGSTWQPGGPCMVGGIDFGGRDPEEGVRSILQMPGADVVYDPQANPGLESRSFSLPAGGRLLPASE